MASPTRVFGTSSSYFTTARESLMAHPPAPATMSITQDERERVDEIDRLPALSGCLVLPCRILTVIVTLLVQALTRRQKPVMELSAAVHAKADSASKVFASCELVFSCSNS
jgi:hypothetical protein